MVINFLKTTWKVLKGTVVGFCNDHCYLHASSLTYYTLLSLVPLMAVTLGVAQGFGFDKALEYQLLERFNEHQEVILKIFEFARSLLHHIRDSMLASVSAVILFFFVLMLFISMETTFNLIWKEVKPRTFMRKLTDYTTLMILCPLFFFAASTLTVFLTQKLETAVDGTYIGLAIHPMITIAYYIFPFLLIWILFTLLYLIMPNTSVRFSSAIIAGVFAGSIYQFVQWFYINFQIGVSQYSAVYGSFAALPLFLIWLQISWTIVLVGAELAYHLELHSPKPQNNQE
ncbi:MAG: YihY/virulence factor BrkB family protein [Chlamydiales bacterium]|nr:YihY/virulence factor BrkB family protein [Chlamydiia bacterium]MCP5507139.1 YihY/virulence factor BrkB family protein [Chlamydiales bacterium]